MTTTTVEVERTVTDEEELHLCDDCQREVDPDGNTFPSEDGEVELHFCSECVEDMSEDFEPEYVERARDWFDTEWETEFGKNRMEREVKSAAHFSKWAAFIGAAIAVGLVTLPMVGVSLPFGNFLLILYGFGAVVMLAINAGLTGDASRAIDKANETLK